MGSDRDGNRREMHRIGPQIARFGAALQPSAPRLGWLTAAHVAPICYTGQLQHVGLCRWGLVVVGLVVGYFYRVAVG